MSQPARAARRRAQSAATQPARQPTAFADLPLDVLALVAAHVPIPSRWDLPRVSKQFRAALAPPSAAWREIAISSPVCGRRPPRVAALTLGPSDPTGERRLPAFSGPAIPRPCPPWPP